GKADEWHLDIVDLFAVTGEFFIAEHAQAITSSALGLLPRITPSPHALLAYPRTRPRSSVYTLSSCSTPWGSLPILCTRLTGCRPISYWVLSIRHNPALNKPPVVQEKRRARLGRRLSRL